MARTMLTALLSLALPVLGGAQSLPIDPPIVGRPIDFSNIVGRYEIKASAAPTVVRVEDSIILTIEIFGKGPAKYEPKRSELRLIPTMWESDFYILDMAEEDLVIRDRLTWKFAYRLKPKSVAVTSIPLIALSYYDPSQPEKNRFQKEYAGPIPIAVTPKADGPPISLDDVKPVPESFYTRVLATEMLGDTPRFELDPYQLGAWMFAPPLVAILAAWLLIRIRQNERDLARQRHDHASAHAQARLSTEPPWEVVASYLQERLAFPTIDATPNEVARFLMRRGMAKPLCERCRAFFAACDAVRFTQTEAAMSSLADEAGYLIRALEADPCVRG